MAPKRPGKKVVGTVLRSTRKIVRETVQVSVVEGETQGSTQEQNGETEDIIDVLEKGTFRTNPVEENLQEEEVQTIEVSVEEPTRKDFALDGSHEKPSREEERKEGQTSEVSQEEPSKEEPKKDVSTSSSQEQEGPSQKEDIEKTNTQEGKETERKERTEEGKGRDGKRKRKRRITEGGEGYKRYVYRVFKQVHPELRISSNAVSVINSLMNDMFERIANEAAKLSYCTHRMTLSSREIQDAVKLVLPGELGKHAISEASKAITNYMSYEAKTSKS